MNAAARSSRRPRAAASVHEAAARAADVALTATQVVYVAVLWLLGCLPLVTAPAATVALIEQLRSWRIGGDSPSASGFARRMRTDPARRSLTMLGVVALHALALIDLYAIGKMGSQRPVVLVVWFAVAAAAVLLSAFVPGLLARGVPGLAAVRVSARLALARPHLAILATAATAAAALLAPMVPLLLPLAVVAVAAMLERTTSHAIDAAAPDLRNERTQTV